MCNRHTASATTGANIITAINAASAATINTARLNSAVVLDTESPVAGDITGNYGAGFQIASGVITGTDLVNNITIATTGNLTGANIIGNGSGLTSLNAGNFSSGTLAVARGGTGITAVTPGGIAYGGASNFAFTPAGTAGQLLQSNGAGAPTWVPAPASFTTVNTVPKGSAGGLIASTIFDSGTYTGIGRTTPIGSSRFDISATGFGAGIYGGMYIQTDNTGWPFYGYSNNGGSSMWTYWNGGTGTWNVYNNGDRLSITNSGNVGIGTSSPALPLHAVGTDAGVGAANSGTAATGSLRLTTGGVPALDIGIADDTYLGGWLQVHQPSNQAINFPLLLNPNGGNVGIGSTTPNAQLQLSNSVGRKIVLFEQANNDNQVMGFSLGGLGTFESQIPINSNAFVWKAGASSTSSTELMRLTGTGSLILANTDWPLNAVQLQSTAANAGASIRFTNPAVGNRTYDLIGSTGDGASPGPGAFGIYDNTSLAYRFVINSAGNVGIGTFSPTQKLHVIGNILASGTITPSDSRLKENISELNYGLKEILRLRPVSYNWKTDPKGKKVLGLIAQETVKITPEVIELPQSEKDFYSMNYVQLIPVLIKAAQELNQKNESLEKENSLLKAEVAAFKQKQDREMASLKKQLEAINSRLGLEAKKD